MKITSEENSRIKLLPEHLINQIKAGEVIERPANLLKEIIENAIDAKASEISISIVNNGLDLIEIKDDGQGMSDQELPLAFCRHATSKISEFSDLFSLQSYGFRGEALASIAAIARVSCSSFPADKNKLAGKITIDGGEIKSHLALPRETTREQAQGTFLSIRDLFYNTPARLKFIKSPTAEKNQIKKVIESFILACPHIKFIILWQNKEKKIYPKQTKEERWQKVFGATSFFLQEEIAEKSYKLSGHISPALGQQKKHYLFVNGRWIQDKNLHQRIIYTLTESTSLGEQANYAIFLSVPESELDVNVHPHKTFVHFEHPGLVYSLVTQGIKNAFRQSSPSTLSSNIIEPASTPMPTVNVAAIDQNNNYFFEYCLPLTKDGPYFLVSWIKNKERQSGILDRSRLVLYHLALAKKQEQHHEVIPLLISEPFHFQKGNIDVHFPLLEEQGLEFDRLDQETLLLRTLPLSWQYLDSFSLVKQLLSYLSNKNKSDFNDLYQLLSTLSEKKAIDLSVDEGRWQDLLKEKDIEELIEHKILRPLTTAMIETLWMHKNKTLS